MSIVERALDKLRPKSGSAAPSGVNERPSHTPEVTTVDRSPRPPTIAPSTGIHAPRTFPADLRPVELDVEDLEARGLLPPLEMQQGCVDEFRRLKWPIMAALLGRGGERVATSNRLMITSSVPSEGKTFTSLNLSLAMTRERETPIILVDADVVRASLTEALGLGGRPGLVDLLQTDAPDIKQVLLRASVPGLYVLPAGRSSPHTPELIGSDHMSQLAQLLSDLAPEGVVVFDTPPVLATNDAQVLARYMGYILMVVRANSTLRRTVQDALGLIADGPPVAFVLNQASRAAVSGYYGGYYRAGYEDRSATGEPSA